MPLLWRQSERAGVQPAEEKALGRPYSSVPVLRRGTRRLERDFGKGM